MTRPLFGPSLALLVPFLGNALAQHAWPLAALLTVVVIAGLFHLAPDAVASPDPASAATDALAIGGGR